MKKIYRRFGYLTLLLSVLLITGTVGFTVIDDYPLFEAFYMTLTTIVTVGYGEILPLSRAGRIFNVVLITAGVTVVFLFIGALTQTVIELELGEVFEKRRNKRMIDKLTDHYIVCGFGRVGRGAAGEFQKAGVPFVVVDNSPERVERASRAGMVATLADSTRDRRCATSASPAPAA
jgi:voltage-gated potassium channel